MLKPNNIAKLSFNLVPCHKLINFKGGYELDPECVADEKEQEKYLQSDEGEYYGFLYYNQETFDVKKYGNEAFQRVSRFYSNQFAYQNPLQTIFYIKGYQLKDQTDLL